MTIAGIAMIVRKMRHNYDQKINLTAPRNGGFNSPIAERAWVLQAFDDIANALDEYGLRLVPAGGGGMRLENHADKTCDCATKDVIV